MNDEVDYVAAHEAFAKAQGEMTDAVMKKTNPHFKSKYADLAAVRAATLPHLTKHGIALTQPTSGTGENFGLYTRLLFKGVMFIESFYPLPNPQEAKPHESGSALTYARRYCWAAICGISSDEDDDGNAAQEQATKLSDAQKVANKLSKSLKGCGTEDELVALWEASQDILDDIKKKSTIAYDALQKVFNAQKERLRPLPEDSVEDIGRDEEIPE